jgi:hypothetical protein
MQPDSSSGIELTMFVVVGILISFCTKRAGKAKAAFQAS